MSTEVTTDSPIPDLLLPHRSEKTPSLNGKTQEVSSLVQVEYFSSGEYQVRLVERLIPDGPKIFLLPGWCGPIDPEDPVLDEFNALGLSAIQVGTPFRIDKNKRKRFTSATEQIADDAKVFADLINKKTTEEESVTIVGCSLGGLSAIETGTLIPSKVDHLELVNPAIRHPIDNIVLLTGRYTGNMGMDTFNSVKEKGVDGFIGALKVAGEAIANPIDSIHRAVGVIHAQDATIKAYQLAKNGMMITVITGNGDGIFHWDKTEQSFRSDFLKEYQKDVRDESIIFDSYLENFIMPRFFNRDGGHDLGLTGKEFAQMIVEQKNLTEEARERKMTRPTLSTTRYTTQDLLPYAV